MLRVIGQVYYGLSNKTWNSVQVETLIPGKRNGDEIELGSSVLSDEDIEDAIMEAFDEGWLPEILEHEFSGVLSYSFGEEVPDPAPEPYKELYDKE
jgi:hypothetical protein